VVGVTARAGVVVIGPSVVDDQPYLRGQVLLANPLAALDNWSAMSRFFRRHVEDVRRAMLAGLASEERRDYTTIDPLLRASQGRAVVMPPSEAFDLRRATEVSFIFDVPIETLRAWKQRYRGERAARKPGAPRKNR
jgi:hypothetical protein